MAFWNILSVHVCVHVCVCVCVSFFKYVCVCLRVQTYTLVQVFILSSFCLCYHQAWTAVQVFKDKYAYTATFQLPLFMGSPTPQMLKQLAREPCKEWLERNIRSGTVSVAQVLTQISVAVPFLCAKSKHIKSSITFIK